MVLKQELALRKRLNNELGKIRQRIDKEENPGKKSKMIKAYRKMSKTLT
jgi:hypothetical protein